MFIVPTWLLRVQLRATEHTTFSRFREVFPRWVIQLLTSQDWVGWRGGGRYMIIAGKCGEIHVQN